ncbi:uncharacterized protein [Typha latifolia]|uniref:uncharacterized protein n=1 Tax=Typha latifolia TaxID=4733 RepID=UPI003C2CE582
MFFFARPGPWGVACLNSSTTSTSTLRTIASTPRIGFYTSPTLDCESSALGTIFMSTREPKSKSPRSRRNLTQAPRDGKPETILPPTPWATEQRATVYPLEYLVAHGITNITGESQCKRCDARHLMTYDLEAKFAELTAFIGARTHLMHDRAPDEWLNPVFPACPSCAQPNCMRPMIAAKKRDINWLFMLLGQTLGCCTLEQLKYFCKHTGNHRTGAKNRVLYFTYLGLCKQLLPSASSHVYPEPKSKSRQIFNPSDI